MCKMGTVPLVLRIFVILCNVRIDQNLSCTCEGTIDMHGNEGKYIRTEVKSMDKSSACGILDRNEYFRCVEVKYLDRRCVLDKSSPARKVRLK